MGIPATSGVMRNLLKDMQIGDYIPIKYKATSGIVGILSEIGTATGTEIPVEGTPMPDGVFYGIKVNKGTIIPDRVLQTNISYNTLNAAGFIYGKSLYFINEIPNVMTSENTPSGYLVTDIAGGSAYPAWTAFNGKITNPISASDCWTPSSVSTKTTPGSASIEMPSTVTVNSITLSTISAGGQNEPTDLAVYFDNNGSWQLCGEMHNNPIGITTLRKIIIPFTKTVTSKKFKVDVWVGNTGGWMNIIELTFGLITNALFISSLTGGCAFVDNNGNKSLTDQYKGAFPINNEWDKYIVNSTLDGKIIAGDNNVWHNNIWSWTKSVPINSMVVNSITSDASMRTIRGKLSDSKWFNYTASTYTNTYGGFRPVIKYIEPNNSSNQTNFWY